jgi:hypothetical protein
VRFRGIEPQSVNLLAPDHSSLANRRDVNGVPRVIWPARPRRLQKAATLSDGFVGSNVGSRRMLAAIETEPVELDSDLISRVRAATPEVATYIEAAVRRELDNETFGRLLDQLETETGPVPEERDSRRG